MKEVIIRKATLDDLENIQKLNNQLFDLEIENYDPTLVKNWAISNEGKEYFEDLINNHYVIVALLEDEIVGYLAGSVNTESSYITKSLAELDNMYVMKEYRQFGIGTKLINKFKEHCLEYEIKEIRVTANFKNKNAIKFYKANGFEDFELTLKTNLN